MALLAFDANDRMVETLAEELQRDLAAGTGAATPEQIRARSLEGNIELRKR